MRGLKILVVVMGLLLVAGVAALTVAIAARLSHRAPASAAAFTASPVMLPKGAAVAAIGTGPDRIVLEIALADGTRELVVLDLATGRMLGRIPLQEQP